MFLQYLNFIRALRLLGILENSCRQQGCWGCFSTPEFRSSVIPTDYGRPERKQPSLHGRKFNPNPKFLSMAAACFVCHIGPIFQISLIYAFIGCPQSVVIPIPTRGGADYVHHITASTPGFENLMTSLQNAKYILNVPS